MDKASWLEVSLVVTPEQAEAVAEVLGRFTPQGVVTERMAKEINSSQTALESHVKVYGYIFIDDDLENTQMRLKEALFYLGRIQPLPEPKYKRIHDQNWMAAWKDQYQPLEIGEKLAILPAWAENVFPDRFAVRINPGMAFGTGTHPTTQLCMQLMESRVTPGMDVFDVGCGSGILSIAAIRLGAARAFGADVSPAAVQSSRENAEINKVSSAVTFAQGSIAEIQQGVFPISEAPLVLVNILAPIILRLFEDGLGMLVSENGRLILSGILDQQMDEILAKAAESGFVLEEKCGYADWSACSLIHD